MGKNSISTFKCAQTHFRRAQMHIPQIRGLLCGVNTQKSAPRVARIIKTRGFDVQLRREKLSLKKGRSKGKRMKQGYVFWIHILGDTCGGIHKVAAKGY
jgi:hypothetical protein